MSHDCRPSSDRGVIKKMKQTCVARALRIRGGRRNDVCERSRAGEEIDQGVH